MEIVKIEEQFVHDTRDYLSHLQWQIRKLSRPNAAFLSQREAYNTAHQGLVDDLALMADIARRLVD